MARSKATRRPFVAVLVLAIGATSCTRAPDSVEYGSECTDFQPDPQNPLTAEAVTYIDAEPPELPTVDPAEIGLDPERLEAAADTMATSGRAASLLVVRDGQLAFERYFNGFGPEDANDVHSLSKSVLSVITGIAIDDGLLDLDSPISEFLPADLVGEHADLTVADMVTMSGGIEVRSPEFEWEPGDTEPFLDRALAPPRVAKPGTELVYSNGLTMILAAVITEAADTPLCDYAAEKLFGPIGVDIDYWHREIGGYFVGGDSLFLTPRDIMRFGQLVADDGVHDGRHIVPAAWLAESLSTRWEVGCREVPWLHQTYGSLWHLFDIGGHAVWVASGHGAQDLAIVDDLDLVVVVTHDTSDRTDGLPVAAIELLDDLLIGAVDGESDPAPSPECIGDAFVMARAAADGTTPGAPIDGWTLGAVGPLSPDGSRVAFTRSADLFTTDVSDVSREVRLTSDAQGLFDSMPAWSPDSSRIAFARGAPDDSDLYLVDAAGGDLSRRTSLDGWENAPTWSPDGTRIAFIHDTTEVPGPGHPGELWVTDDDGSNARMLRAEPTASPAWSPDGTRIAFSDGAGDEHIRVLDLDSGTVTDLGEGGFPRWSPDSSRLVFLLLDGEGSSDLFTIAADGTDRQQITDDPDFDTMPQWAPDGTTLWYATRPVRP